MVCCQRTPRRQYLLKCRSSNQRSRVYSFQVLTAGSTLTTDHTITYGSGVVVTTYADTTKGDYDNYNYGEGLWAEYGDYSNVNGNKSRIDFYKDQWGIESERNGVANGIYSESTSQYRLRLNSRQFPSGLGGNSTSIYLTPDSILIQPDDGQINIDSLRTWSGIADTTYKKPMTWDTRNGRWEYAENWPQQKISLVFGAGSGEP